MGRVTTPDAESLHLEDRTGHIDSGAVCVFADPSPSFDDIAGPG